MTTVCAPCGRDECLDCDGTAWEGDLPTFCVCWANGHPWRTRTRTEWVGGEGAPQEDAAMDAYERGRGE